jgi:hypothetical protein
MKRWLYFLLALALYALVHEGMHALTAAAFGEYDSFHVRPFGLEVVFKTPVAERAGAHWALISGAGNVLTLLMGYGLALLAPVFARSPNPFWKASAYYVTVLFLLLDALNLSLGPFFYGGDANGIAAGLGVNRLVIQGVFLIVLLVNREIIARRVLPAYGVQTDAVLLKPWGSAG